MPAVKMSEAQFQRRITDYCDLLHLKWHHEVDSRKSKSGFPDLLIAGPEGVLFVELKVGRNRVSPAQWEWIDKLTQAGAEVHVWFPDDWDTAQRRLAALAGRRL